MPGGDVKRVVYLFPGPPDAHALAQFGASELRAAGFELEALDLSALVLPGKAGAPRDVGVPVTRIASRAELDEYFADHIAETVALDFIAGLEPTVASERVLARIGALGVRYVIVFAAALPPLPAPKTAAEQMGRRMRRLQHARNPRRLAAFVSSRARRLLRATPSVPLPAAVFATRSPSLEGYIATRGLPDERFVPINSYDYDAYLRYGREHDPMPAQEDIAVFLDEAASSHPDFKLFGTQRIAPTDERYSATMRRLFDEVEAKTGLRVVVAAHPRSDYDSRPGFFGDREVVCGRTLDLTVRSRFVIAHCTTALSFAVILRRPTLLTTTAEMQRTIYSLQIERMEAALGLGAVHIDEPGALEAIDWEYASWPTAGFADYERRYARSPDADPSRTTWEIVAEKLAAGL